MDALSPAPPMHIYRPLPIIRVKKNLYTYVRVRPLQGLGNLLYLELGPAQ